MAEANLGLCPPQLHSNMRQPSLWVCTQAVQGSPLPPPPPSLYLLVHLRFPLLCPPSVLSCLHAVLQKWAGISLCLPTCIAHSTRVCCQVPITPVLPLRFCSLVAAVAPSAQHSRHGDPRIRRAKAERESLVKVWLQTHTFTMLNCVTCLSVDGMGISLRQGEKGFGLTSRCIAWPLTEMEERAQGKDRAIVRAAPLDMLCLRNLYLL